jgi:hypothetical protein
MDLMKDETMHSVAYNVLECLVRHGAGDVNKGYRSDNGLKAIHHACLVGHPKLVELLSKYHRLTNNAVSMDSMIRSEKRNKEGIHQTTAINVIDIDEE